MLRDLYLDTNTGNPRRRRLMHLRRRTSRRMVQEPMVRRAKRRRRRSRMTIRMKVMVVNSSTLSQRRIMRKDFRQITRRLASPAKMKDS
jgi:hypothetical protein